MSAPQTLGRGALRALPTGTLLVGVGLGVLGLSAYAFLTLSGRAVGPADFAALSVLWVLVNALGPGLLQPLEQEVARAVSARAAHGAGGRPVLARAAVIGAAMVAAVALVAVLMLPVTRDRLLGGSTALLGCLMFTLAAMWGSYLTRGAFAGQGRFHVYGIQLGVDGIVRLVGAAALFLVGVSSPAAYGVLLALAPALALAVTAPRPARLLEPGPPAQWRDVTQALGILLVASVGSQLVVNGGPLAVQLLARPGEAAAAGVFLAGLVVARVPLFLFAAVQAAMLPGLARLATVGDWLGFRSRLRGILAVVAALGVAGTLGCLALGPEAVALFFGPRFVVDRWQLTGLAVATALFMVATVLAQALVAARSYRPVALGWAIAVVVFLLALVPEQPLEDRVTWSFIAACLAAAASMLVAVVRRLRRTQPAPPPQEAP